MGVLLSHFVEQGLLFRLCARLAGLRLLGTLLSSLPSCGGALGCKLSTPDFSVSSGAQTPVLTLTYCVYLPTLFCF